MMSSLTLLTGDSLQISNRQIKIDKQEIDCTNSLGQFDLKDDDDAKLDGARATREIIPPPLAPEVKFNITCKMIQLPNLKGYLVDYLGMIQLYIWLSLSHLQVI